MTEGFSWQCPFCGRPVTLLDQNLSTSSHHLLIKNQHGDQRLDTLFMVCPNEECREFVLKASLEGGAWRTHPGGGREWDGSTVDKQRWDLVPQSNAQVWPDYVPRQIREDYQEACAIRALSPKASAALSRRCLQGMIRDFFGIRKDTLKQEIDTLREKVGPGVWDAIDGVRRVGNVGAHMEKYVNLIIPLDSDEANVMIGLLEELAQLWYVDRHNRELRITAMTKLAEEKDEARQGQNDANAEGSP